MAREVKTDQDYKMKLLKLIPSEIVAAYILIGSIIPVEYKYWGIWQEWIGSVLLILYTLTIPLFYHPRAETVW
jgi:hypothetical protein